MSSRLSEINTAILKLESFKLDPRYAGNPDMLYVIEENLLFLKSIRSLPRYFAWLIGHACHIDGARLKELTDFPVPEWDVKMHTRLIEMQRKEKVGLIEPLVQKICEYIVKENRELVMANFGAGGMEVDRQVITRLLQKKYPHKITFVAVDKSSTVTGIAKKNLLASSDISQDISKNIEIREINHLTTASLKDLRKSATKNILVILCKNDIFELPKDFPKKYFDLIYHSLFKHHLPVAQQDSVDAVISTISKNSIEYEGYRSYPVVIPQTIVGWNYPAFFNAEIFSNLRFKTKKEVQKKYGVKNISVQSSQFSEPRFFVKTGCYIIER
jgi:hypothetical protein